MRKFDRRTERSHAVALQLVECCLTESHGPGFAGAFVKEFGSTISWALDDLLTPPATYFLELNVHRLAE